MANKKRKEQTLLTGAGTLAIAAVLVKLIGAVYKLPLLEIFGEVGNSYFTKAYQIYTTLYAISMAGLPVAVSKMVSQNVELGRIKDAQRVYKVSVKLFMTVGLVGTALLMVLSVPASNLMGSHMAYISVLTVAPCIFLCCMMSSFRGYYEGLKNMVPTGVSQVIEAAIKVVFGLSATYLAMKKWKADYTADLADDGIATVFGTVVSSEAEALSVIYPYAAAVAIFGVTFGSLVGLIYLIIKYKRSGFGFTREEIINSPEAESDKSIMKQLIKIAAPVALSSVVLNISNLIDNFTIGNRLEYAVEKGYDVIKAMYGAALTASMTLDTDIDEYLFGTHGAVINIKNLVPTITLTLGVSVIPILTAAWTRKDKKETKVAVESALRVAMMIAAPAGFGIAALAHPILDLLYSSREPMHEIAAPMMIAYGLGMVFFATTSPMTNMLQAVGRMDIPVKSIAIGSCVKIVLNYILIGNPQINIFGVPISTMVCYIIIFAINLTSLLKVTGVKLNFVSVFLKPLFAGILCGVTAFGINWLCTSVLGIESRLITIVAIGFGAVVYAISLLLVKGLAKDDVLMLPKGEKIAKVLAKFRLLG